VTGELTRRTFVRAVAAGGGGLLLGMWVSSCSTEPGPATTPVSGSAPTAAPELRPITTTDAPDPTAVFAPDLLLRIDDTGAVTVTVPKSEMGQGVHTALAMVVAEELDADWDRVRVETAPADPAYGDQVTGGSLSISTRYESMRIIGATARAMLISAAAAGWDGDPAACTTSGGVVIDSAGDRRATYGSLAKAAAGIDVPAAASLTLKDPSGFRIVGTPRTLIDAEAMVTGRAVYGSDVRIPEMAYATVARAPVFRQRVDTYDDTAALAVPGVVAVIEISSGVAVVAETTWAALEGRKALTVAWRGDGDLLDDAEIRGRLANEVDHLAPGPGEITAEYSAPFLPHAPIETLTCVARVGEGRFEVWAGTQDPQLARSTAARGASRSYDRVTVQVPLLGGGFGRRLRQDFVEETAELAAAFGRPVQLFRSRTDDLRHDTYHPAAVSRAVGDPTAPERLRIETASAGNTSVPTGPWRAVTNVPQAFAHESFVAELADAAGADRYEYRGRLLGSRAAATLDRAAEAAGWGEPLPAGRGRGIAHHATWGVSPTSMVAEVSVDGAAIRIDRMVCAIDCGVVVNPDTVAAQLEGAVAFAGSAVLHGGVSIARGAIVESNFDDAPLLRFDEMPEVEVHIIDSGASPTGVGEAGVPPVAPAIANAVFAATGRRLRDLPLRMA
jgi:CO/xanthine dehydrogenase Mo-binding subunit